MTRDELLGTAEDLLVGLRFAASLPFFLRRTITLEQARASLARFIVTHPTTPVPDDLQSLSP